MNHRSQNQGFSLVEANLAILVVAVGLLSLFSLFPAGLRQSDLSQADTRQALFAEYVLSRVIGNAAEIKDWNTWKDFAAFRAKAVDGGLTMNAVSKGPWSNGAQTDRMGNLEGYIWEMAGAPQQPGFPPRYRIVLGECKNVNINAIADNPGLGNSTHAAIIFPIGPSRRFVWVQSSDKASGLYETNPHYYSEMIYTGM